MIDRMLCAMTALVTTLCTAAPANEELRFKVQLDGKDIGHHSFSVVRDGGREIVSSTADFDVTFLAIPVYSYDHSAREVWNQGCRSRKSEP